MLKIVMHVQMISSRSLISWTFFTPPPKAANWSLIGTKHRTLLTNLGYQEQCPEGLIHFFVFDQPSNVIFYANLATSKNHFYPKKKFQNV